MRLSWCPSLKIGPVVWIYCVCLLPLSVAQAISFERFDDLRNNELGGGGGRNCRNRMWSSVPAFSPRKPQDPRPGQAVSRQRFELDIYWIDIRNVTVWAIVLGHELHEWHSHSDFFTTLHSRLCEELWRIWTCSWNLSKLQLKLCTVSSSVTVA